MKFSFFKKSHLFAYFCLLIVFIHFAQILYFQRSYFIEKYDVSYWKDRFEHSQWQLPLSKRIIGDDGLFAYVGYTLFNGVNVAGVNAETPPVGKYLIGFSIVLFKNPAYYGLFFGVGSLVFFFLIARKVFHKNIALFTMALLFLDPLFFTQFWKSWLEIAQLFFLLFNIFLFFCLPDSKSKKTIGVALLSGFVLGLFAETKLPVLLPIIFVLEVLFLLRRKQLSSVLVFFVGIISAVVLSYSQYFLLGHNFVDFAKLQKYIFSFYLQSGLVVHKGALLQVLLFGKFPDIVTSVSTIVSEWWIAWAIITLLGLPVLLILLFRKDTQDYIKGFAVFLLAGLLLFSFIPSYPRYLLVLLPFLYAFSVMGVQRLIRPQLQMILFVIILVYGLVHAGFFLLPSPQGILNNFYYNFSRQYFHDIYQEDLTQADQAVIPRERFRFIAQDALVQAEVKAIDVKELNKNIPIFAKEGYVKIRITYKTQNLGPFVEDKIIELVKDNGQWKIVWNWDLVLEGFRPGYRIETNRVIGKRGAIVDDKGEVLAKDSSGYLVLVNPEKIDLQKEEKMLKFMQSYNYRIGVALQNAYLENALPSQHVPLMTLHVNITDKEKNKFLSYPGVALIEYPTRIYKDFDPNSIQNTFYEECCTRIYSSYNYRGVKGLEKLYDAELSGYDGGIIALKKKDGELVRQILKKEKKDGKDIVLPYVVK